jgi:6-phosphogluconolactonase
VTSYPDQHAAAAAAASHIVMLLTPQKRATLAISGGSTPKLMFEELVKSNVRWEHVHLFFVDERAVAPTNPDSNYKLAEESLIVPAQIPRANVHRIEGELPPERAAEDYINDIRTFFKLDKGQMPQFDIIHHGMGPEAHTASLFPGDPLIEDRHNIAAAVEVPKPPPLRVTLLPGVLLSAAHTVFLVCGDDKAPAVQAVIEGGYDPMRLPAQLIARHARDVSWFLDDAASRLLEEPA